MRVPSSQASSSEYSAIVFARQSLKYGIHLVIAAHSWRSQDVPRSLSASFATRVSFRVNDDTSAAVVLDIEEKGHKKLRLWFSGDIGRRNLPLLRDPVLPSGVDVMIMECTYGDKPHREPEMAYEEMFRTLNIRIRQFAKRQDTWFRGMERRGIAIHWIDGADEAALQELIEKTLFPSS